MATKTVAVVGGGIFGVTTALELAKKFKVVLFEKENDIFSGATYVNQYRHHMGYHYPRSPKTVKECRESKNDFEEVFTEALVRPFPYYYAVAKKDTKTSTSDYLRFLKREKLPFKFEHPRELLLDGQKVEVCFRVPETVYDFQTLKNIALRKIAKSKNFRLKLGGLVTGGEIGANGRKKIFVKSVNGKETFDFDFLVNATYSNYNLLCKAFGIKKKNLQFELVELLIIKLPIKGKIGLTIMDGPFTCVLPMGETGYFTLGHVDASVHRREIVEEEEMSVVKNWGRITTRKDKIINTSLEFLPFLKDTNYIKSLYITRTVNPENEKDDGRPTEIKDHGFGFYSIFAGKIITCVSTAKKVRTLLEKS